MYDDIIKDTWGAKVESLRELIKIQSRQGNWDYDPYMHGMLNGMILALSVMTGEDAEFFEAPKEWGYERVAKLRPEDSFFEWWAVREDENEEEAAG